MEAKIKQIKDSLPVLALLTIINLILLVVCLVYQRYGLAALNLFGLAIGFYDLLRFIRARKEQNLGIQDE
jgi:hypothetical protein